MKILTILLITAFTNLVYASECKHLYPNGIKIEIENTIELCNTVFVIAYDPIKKANIFSSERINAQPINANRVNTFRRDNRLLPNQRAELSDYEHSIYDRGHMAPADNMETYVQMRESFLLSNMTPQNKNLNRGKWKSLENNIKKNKEGVVYILTAAYYGNKYDTIGKNNIPVPQEYFKCIWYKNDIECFHAFNMAESEITKVSFNYVKEKLGIKHD